MLKKIIGAFFVCLLIQNTHAGSVIQSIQIKGNQRVESDTILSYCPLKVGQNTSSAELEASLKDLYKTGYFADVKVYTSGSVLVIEVQENPIINQVVFEGNSKLKDDIIKQEVRLREREVLSKSRVQEVQQRLLEIYRRMGLFSAKVEPKVIKLSDNRVNLVFEINEGPVTYVRAINFINNKHFSDKQLEAKLLTKVARWYRFMASDDVYDSDRFLGDQQSIRKFYNDNGYADFRILSAVAELSPDQKYFVLTFTLEEGKCYRFGKINIISHIPSLKPEQLKKEIAFLEKDIFSGYLIERSVTNITNKAGMNGYAFVAVVPKIEKDEATQTVNITFELKEGPRVYIEKITFVGNDRTYDDVLRRELTIHEGDAYNSAKIKQSEQNLKDLQYFKSVTLETEQGSAPDQAQLVAKVEEQSTGEVTFAMGFSTIDGPLGNIRVVERNFRGKGQTVHVDLTLAKRRQDFDVGIVEPYLFGYNLQGSADLFSVRSTRFNSYKQFTKGFSLGLGYRLSQYWGQGWSYGLRDDKVSNVSNDSSKAMKEQEGNSLISTLTHSLSYDRRNSRIMPTAGYVVSLSNSFAGLGGNVSYLRNDLSGNWYYSPFDEIVLGVKGSVGAIKKIKKSRIVDNVLLGADSLRGFEYGGLGPVDSIVKDAAKSNDAIIDALGGTRYWTASVEVMFPLGLPEEFGVRGAAFTDFGNVWKHDCKPMDAADAVKGSKRFDKGSFRHSVGIGVSWLSPFGPLRIDYAIPLKKEKYDRVQRVLVGFATRF